MILGIFKKNKKNPMLNTLYPTTKKTSKTKIACNIIILLMEKQNGDEKTKKPIPIGFFHYIG